MNKIIVDNHKGEQYPELDNYTIVSNMELPNGADGVALVKQTLQHRDKEEIIWAVLVYNSPQFNSLLGRDEAMAWKKYAQTFAMMVDDWYGLGEAHD